MDVEQNRWYRSKAYSRDWNFSSTIWELENQVKIAIFKKLSPSSENNWTKTGSVLRFGDTIKRAKLAGTLKIKWSKRKFFWKRIVNNFHLLSWFFSTLVLLCELWNCLHLLIKMWESDFMNIFGEKVRHMEHIQLIVVW